MNKLVNNSAKKSAKMAAKSSLKFYSNISEMEPLWPKKELMEEKTILLMKRSYELSSKLHPLTRGAVARLLELMNSYYSNRIEGNTTRPLDIERALKHDYASEPGKKALQIETSAHIEVQREFEAKVRANPDLDICSTKFLCDIHRAYYEKLPPQFRSVRSREGKILELIPGQLRKDEVEIGLHIPPAADTVGKFMNRFHEVYEPRVLGSSVDKVIAAAASHHRLTWIHPFLDGNGRVVRLLTHLYFIRADVSGNGLWALSRGLGRKQEEYYGALAGADEHRYNDYDGRGNLSLKGLNAFTEFLLDVAIDQVDYMSETLEVEKMEEGIRKYAKYLSVSEGIDEACEYILLEIFYHGEVSRSEIKRITGLPERSARRVTDALSKKNIIVSETPLSPWRWNFTVEASRHVFPSLFPA